MSRLARRVTLRTFLTSLMAVLVLACPLVCGADEACQETHRHSEAEKESAPPHCPEDSDNCICRGAVQTVDVRASFSHPLTEPSFAFWTVGSFNPSLSHSLTHLTIGGTPAGLAGWGDTLTVRALLQNFRF